MLDLDGLKAVNDQLGHQAGDERIQAWPTRSAMARARDVGYRVGGDEFAVILPGSRALGRARVHAAPARGAGCGDGVGIAEAADRHGRDPTRCARPTWR